ncbi:MAG: hypothetical protein IPF73_13955 [Betaproteobacteria bacterium]|nr:hypothetical protein [Betaproteobacteria bacterium]
MLICIIDRLIASQFSITRSSPILRSTSAGSSAANIIAGFGNGMPGMPAPPCGAPAGAACGIPGIPKPGIGTPKGFHIFCMNSSACCGVG